MGVKIKKYWCDPEHINSGFIDTIEDTEAIDSVDITLVGETDRFSVYFQDIIDVLVSTDGLTLDWIINHPEFDKDYYLHHLGGAEFKYRGFTMAVFGEQSTFLNGERFFKSPELLIEFKDKLEFGNNSWIEIINDNDLDIDYDVCSSFKEAKKIIDSISQTR